MIGRYFGSPSNLIICSLLEHGVIHGLFIITPYWYVRILINNNTLLVI